MQTKLNLEAKESKSKKHRQLHDGIEISQDFSDISEALTLFWSAHSVLSASHDKCPLSIQINNSNLSNEL